MIYIRIKFLSCIFLIVLISIAYSKPASDLRQKLERLLRDPEYDDERNEIHKPRQIQGMLLRDLREHGLFDSSSEERFYSNLNKLEKTSERSMPSKEEKLSPSSSTTTTGTLNSKTTAVPPTLGSATANASTTTGQRSPTIIGGIERLSSIISKIIDLWRKS